MSAVEQLGPGLYSRGAPAIRLCLIYPGRGRATRRRTAANATDAIETKEGGWCWTSQTAIGWGPLPKRDLSRLTLLFPFNVSETFSKFFPASFFLFVSEVAILKFFIRELNKMFSDLRLR